MTNILTDIKIRWLGHLLQRVVKRRCIEHLWRSHLLSVSVMFFFFHNYKFNSEDSLVFWWKERQPDETKRVQFYHWPVMRSLTFQFSGQSRSHARDRRPARLHQPPQCRLHTEDLLEDTKGHFKSMTTAVFLLAKCDCEACIVTWCVTDMIVWQQGAWCC